MPQVTYWSGDPRSGIGYELKPPAIPDGQRSIPAGLAGERGSTWDETRLFEWYENDLIFLRGPVQDFEIEAMLRTDGKARAVEQVLTLPIRGARYQIDKPDGDRGQHDLVMRALTLPADQGGMRTSLRQVLAQATSACLYRSSAFEKVFKIADDGRVVYDAVAYRPPTSVYLARNAKTAQLQGFLQWTWTDIARFERIYIPQAKSWIYIHGLHRDPILGSSDIEVCWRAFETKQKIRFLWNAFMENQVTPKAIAKKLTGDDPAGAAALARQVATLKGGGVVGITAADEVTPWDSQPQAASVFQQAVNYLDEEMYASVMANFLGLGTASGIRGGGSFALSLSQTDFYLQSRQAVLDELAETVTHGLIAPLVRWNFGKDAAVPQFRYVGLAPTSNTTEAILQMVTALVATPPPPGGVSAVPQEFIDELVDTTAGQLGLDGNKVHEAIIERRGQLDSHPGVTPQTAPVHAAVDVAHQLVTAAGGVSV